MFDLYRNITLSQAGSNGSGGGGGGGGTTTFDTDSGTATPAAGIITFNAISQAGASVFFSGAGSTVSLNTTDANGNTILGIRAGNPTLSGLSNTLFGGQAGESLTSGGTNVGFGQDALNLVTTGNTNVGFGTNAFRFITTGNRNVGIGDDCGGNYVSSESDNIIIGRNMGVASESNVIRIGGGTGSGNDQQNKCFISGINGSTITSQVPVAIDPSTDQLAPSNGTNASLPAFLVYLPTNDSNVTGTGTTYTLGTNVPLTIVFDQGSNFNTNGTFTAPLTGRYHFDTKIQVVGTTTASQAILDITTTARAYETALQRTASGQIICMTLSCLADMTAGDTAIVQISVSGEVSDSDVLLGNNTQGCFFSGYLAC